MSGTFPRRTKRQKLILSLLRDFQPMTAPDLMKWDNRRSSHSAILCSLRFLIKHGVVEVAEEKGPGVTHGSYRLTRLGESFALGCAGWYRNPR